LFFLQLQTMQKTDYLAYFENDRVCLFFNFTKRLLKD
jgi:hypothetical protein